MSSRVREDADGVERRRMFLEVQKLVGGQPNAMRLAARLVSHELHDLNESIGSGNKRTEQHTVDDAEDGGRCANAERKGEDGHGREAGVPCE